jgi:hypothetical protein
MSVLAKIEELLQMRNLLIEAGLSPEQIFFMIEKEIKNIK